MFDRHWPAMLTKVGTTWKIDKKTEIAAVKGAIKLEMPFEDGLAESLEGDAEKARAILRDGASGAKVRFPISCGKYVLVIADGSGETDEEIKINTLSDIQASASNSEGGPQLDVTIKFPLGPKSEVPAFLHAHLGPVLVELQERQMELPGTGDGAREAAKRFKDAIPEGDSVTVSFEGKSVTVKGKGKKG